MTDPLLEAKQKLEAARKSYAKVLAQLSEAGCDVDALMEAENARLLAECERLRERYNEDVRNHISVESAWVREVQCLRTALAMFADRDNWDPRQDCCSPQIWRRGDARPWTIAQEALSSQVEGEGGVE